MVGLEYCRFACVHKPVEKINCTILQSYQHHKASAIQIKDIMWLLHAKKDFYMKGYFVDFDTLTPSFCFLLSLTAFW